MDKCYENQLLYPPDSELSGDEEHHLPLEQKVGAWIIIIYSLKRAQLSMKSVTIITNSQMIVENFRHQGLAHHVLYPQVAHSSL